MKSPPALMLPSAAAGAWASCALVGARPAALPALAGGALVAATGAVVFLRSRRSARALLVALLVGSVAGAVAAGVRSAADAVDPLRAEGFTSVRATMTILDEPVAVRDGSGRSAVVRRAEGSRCRVTARVERLVRGSEEWVLRSRVLVIGNEPWCHVTPGARVSATVNLGESSEQRPGGPSRIATATGEPSVVAAPTRLSSAITRIRTDLREAAQRVPWSPAALVPALVVGDETALTDGAVDDLRGAGLGHLTAVSGANVASVLLGVLTMGVALGMRRRALALLTVVTVVGFAALARAEPSVLRASAMAILAALAVLRSGRVPGPSILAGSVLMLVLIDPALAREPGFTLSVVATAALLAAASFVRRRRSGRTGIRVAVLGVLVATIAAQACVAPLVAAWSGRLDVGGVVANVVVAPLVPLITVLGVAAAVVAPASAVVAEALVAVASLPASGVLEVASRVADNSWSGLPWPRGSAGGAVLAALLGVVVGIAWFARGARAGGPRRWPARDRTLAVTSLGLVVIVLVVAPIDAEARWPPARWRLVMCDVGQGDAVVLAPSSSAAEGAIVVDAGPDVRVIDRCLRDLGVDHVALLVLSHFHADHATGLAGVLRDRRVDQILVSPLAEPQEQAERVRQVADDAGVARRIAVTGAAAHVAGWRLEVLGPGRRDPDASSAPNDSSVVVLATRGDLEVLLMGDAELAAQRRVLTSRPDAARADVVKVAHHGSAVQDPWLLARARASVVLVGVGCGNRYGHPAAATLSAYERRGAVVGRTDRDGDLAVVASSAGPRLVVRGGDPRSPARVRCR